MEHDPTRPLTQGESDIFDAIVDNGHDHCLMSVLFDNEPTAAICRIHHGDGYEIYPVAVLITDTMFDRLTPPTGAEPIDQADDPDVRAAVLANLMR